MHNTNILNIVISFSQTEVIRGYSITLLPCAFVRVSNSPTDIRNIIYIINLPLPYALPTLAAKKSLTDL